MQLRVQDANLDVHELYRMFSKYDQVKMNVIKGIAYVIFTDPLKAEQARLHFNAKVFEGKALKIDHYDPQQHTEHPPAAMQLEEPTPALNTNSLDDTHFHPVVLNVRNQFVKVVFSELQQLNREYKKAEENINKLMIDESTKGIKLKALKNWVNKEKEKMMLYLSTFRKHVCLKFDRVTKTHEIDLETSPINPLRRVTALSGEERDQPQVVLSYEIKSPVTRLAKVSNTEFMASFDKEKSVCVFTTDDPVANHELKCAYEPHALGNYVWNQYHWGLVGSESGKISTVELHEQKPAFGRDKQIHSNKILEIKPLITNPYDEIEYYLSCTAHTIKKWKISTEEIFNSIYDLEFSDHSEGPKIDGNIITMEVLSKAHVGVGTQELKFKLFDLETNQNILTFPSENKIRKIAKIDATTIAYTNGEFLKGRDIRTNKEILSKNMGCSLSIVSLFDQNKLVFGGKGSIGVVDRRKINEKAWVDKSHHSGSYVRDILMMDRAFVSADEMNRMHLWRF